MFYFSVVLIFTAVKKLKPCGSNFRDDGDGRERTLESGAQGGGVIALSMVLKNSFFNCCWMSGRD